MTSSERKERFDALSRIGCIVCRVWHGVHTTPQIHHLTGLQYRAMGKKAKDEDTCPLCVYHHTGGNPDILSVHGTPKLFRQYYADQTELLRLTNEILEAAK